MSTKIEWTDETWNPVTGCAKISEGCCNCYAERMAKRLRGRHGYPPDEPFRVTLHPGRLDQPPRWRRPRKVFVCSMGDLFHKNVPFEFIELVFAKMWLEDRHIFQILTKRPSRMLEFYDWFVEDAERAPLANNVWLGVSVENQQAADGRIPILLQIPAMARFVSCEPLLGAIDIEQWLISCDGCGNRGSVAFAMERPGQSLCRDACTKRGEGPSLDWVIVGGESGPGARLMHPDWARSLRDQCQVSGVPFFMKQMSNKVQIPDDLMIREFPERKGISDE